MTLICKQNSCGDVRCRCAADARTGNPVCLFLERLDLIISLITSLHMYSQDLM